MMWSRQIFAALVLLSFGVRAVLSVTTIVCLHADGKSQVEYLGEYSDCHQAPEDDAAISEPPCTDQRLQSDVSVRGDSRSARLFPEPLPLPSILCPPNLPDVFTLAASRDPASRFTDTPPRAQSLRAIETIILIV